MREGVWLPEVTITEAAGGVRPPVAEGVISAAVFCRAG